jgi:hypothetical protein
VPRLIGDQCAAANAARRCRRRRGAGIGQRTGALSCLYSTFRLVASQQGQARQEYFNTGVFRLRGGEWRAITWQATRLGETAPE